MGMSDPTYDGLCGIPCIYNVLHRCMYEIGHGGDHSWANKKTHLVIQGGVFQDDMNRWFNPVPKNCTCTPLRDDSGKIVEYIFCPECPAHTKGAKLEHG
jgi:hypothetical protein